MFDFLLPLRFVATFLVPSVFPAMISTLGIFVSLFTPRVAAFSSPPDGTSESFALNALAWIGVVTLLATLALTLKKLFGRQPSLDAILSGLVTNETLEDYKKEQHLRHRGLEEQISKVRHDTDERLNKDLVSTERRFDEIMSFARERARDSERMRDQVSRLDERTKTYDRKLDAIDNKLDRLVEAKQQRDRS